MNPYLDLESPAVRPEIAALIARVCSALGTGWTVTDVCGQSRVKSLVEARHIAMWLARRSFGLSYPELGRIFGNRDHGTVMHAVRKMESFILFAPDLFIVQVALALEQEFKPMAPMLGLTTSGAREIIFDTTDAICPGLASTAPRLLTLPAVCGTVELDLAVGAAE